MSFMLQQLSIVDYIDRTIQVVYQNKAQYGNYYCMHVYIYVCWGEGGFTLFKSGCSLSDIWLNLDAPAHKI